MAAKEKSQSEKFIEKAKELGADESEKVFDGKLTRVAKHQPTRPDKGEKK
jgi:hypothetical protein